MRQLLSLLVILWAVRGNVTVRNRELLPAQASIELEEHWQEVFMRAEQLLPDSDCLEYLGVNNRRNIVGHQESACLKEELLSADLRVER